MLSTATFATQEHELNDLSNVGSLVTVGSSDDEINVAHSQSHLQPQRDELGNEVSNTTSNIPEQGAASLAGLPPRPPPDFVEGGLRGWINVLGSFLGLMANFGLVNAIGAIQSHVATNQLQNVSTSTVGWVFSIFLFSASGFNFVSGELFDRHGPTWLLICGTILLSGGLVATASCTAIWQFVLAFSLVTGLGCAMLMSPLIGVISHYFEKRRAFAMSLATLGGSVGGAVFPIMLQKLYGEVGFVWALRIFALVCLVLGMSSACLVRSRPRTVEASDDPTKRESFLQIMAKTIDLPSIVSDAQFRYVVFGTAFGEMSILTTSTMYSSYAIDKGFSSSIAILQLTIISLVGIAARFIGGYVADIYGSFNVAVVMTSWSVLIALVIWLPFGATTIGLYIYSVLFGISCAAVFSIYPACIAKVSRVENIGRRYATTYVVVAIGTLVSVPIGGAIIGTGSTLRYDLFILYIAVLATISTVMFLLSRACAVGWKPIIY